MAMSSSLRASDADRDAIAERLRQAAVEGRLEPHELEERLDTALRARTYGELDRLVVDLPGRRRVERSRPPVFAASLALAMAVRIAVLLLVVTALMFAFAVTAAWWLLGLIVWVSVRAARGSCSRRSAWHHHQPPRARRVY
jgi:hypothetical protein